jgi:Golgi nucleoside diphosphatase
MSQKWMKAWTMKMNEVFTLSNLVLSVSVTCCTEVIWHHVFGWLCSSVDELYSAAHMCNSACLSLS